jgi:hypothetical protein
MSQFGFPNLDMMAGYSQPYGNIPQQLHQQAMQSNFPIMQPYMPAPQHFNPMAGFGPQFNQGMMGMIGPMIGQLAESFMSARGYSYAPPQADPYAIMFARQQERQLERLGQMGLNYDINRGARYGQDIFGMDPATAYGFSSTLMPIIPQLARGMPGGSARDFAQAMYGATQVMRDYTTPGSFNIGLSGYEGRQLTENMLQYFIPNGRIDPSRTGGLQLGQLGGLATALSSEGLLRSGVSDSQFNAELKRVGLDPGGMSTTQLASARGIVRSDQMGKQISEYADVVSMMGDLMGKRDAPIPELLRNLKELTGGEMSQMSATEMSGLLLKVRETGRIAGIASQALVEMGKQAAAINQSMGISGAAGVEGMTQSLLATVAAQTSISGPFEGRMSGQQMMETRERLRNRATTSQANVVSVNAAQYLDMVRDQVPAAQQAQFDSLYSQAMAGQLNQSNLGQVVGFAQSAGLDTTGLRTNLQSWRRASQFQDEYQGITERVANVEQGKELRGVLNRTIGRLGKTSGLTGQQISDVTSAIWESGDGTSGSIRAQLDRIAKDRGYSEDQISSMMQFGQRAMYDDRVLRDIERMNLGPDVHGVSGAIQLFGGVQQRAYERLRTVEQRRIAGAKLLGESGVRTTDSFFQRLVGELGQGGTAKDAAIRAAGFFKDDEMYAPFRGQMEKMKSAYDKMQSAATPEDKATATAEFRAASEALRDAAGGDFQAIAHMEGALDFLSGTKGMKLVDNVDDANALVKQLSGAASDPGLERYIEEYSGAGAARMAANRRGMKNSLQLARGSENLINELRAAGVSEDDTRMVAARAALVTHTNDARRDAAHLREQFNASTGGGLKPLPKQFQGIPGEANIITALGDEEWNLRHKKLSKGDRIEAFKKYRAAAMAYKRRFYTNGELDVQKIRRWANRTGKSGSELQKLIEGAVQSDQSLRGMMGYFEGSEGNEEEALKGIDDLYAMQDKAYKDSGGAEQMRGFQSLSKALSGVDLSSIRESDRLRTDFTMNKPQYQEFLDDVEGLMGGPDLSQYGGLSAVDMQARARHDLRTKGSLIWKADMAKVDKLVAQYSEETDPAKREILKGKIKDSFTMSDRGKALMDELAMVDPDKRDEMGLALGRAKEAFVGLRIGDEASIAAAKKAFKEADDMIADATGKGKNDINVHVTGEMSLLDETGKPIGKGAINNGSQRDAEKKKAKEKKKSSWF